MKKTTSCTLRDVAEHLGISHATVSRALRDDPRITEAVRRRVRQAAQKLGYRRDPKLAELMTHLRGSKQRAFHGTLAWITDLDMASAHHRWLHSLNFSPASERAGELGYKLEPFTHVTPADAPRLAHTLEARGIRGIALMFFFRPVNLEEWRWDWNRLALVHAGTIPAEPKFDIVDADYTANSLLLFKTLAGRGYRRIGIATALSLEQCLNYALCAAGDLFARLQPNHPMFDPCLLPEVSAATAPLVQKWIKRHRVDCVVTTALGMRDLLAKTLGYRLPKDLGLAAPGVDPKGDWSGVNQRDNLITKTVVETLATAVERGRFGIPESPRRILLPGVWYQGATCR
ncbi:MAG: LacI family DNA-binding transcriptional regulator [Verrucomicrobia bacterium]|nr:LacI family DNA-binding transcriptional regulator [Verrucomicrobiota bacterium]